MKKDLYVSKSKINGKGIFTKRDIKKGENICVIKGPEMFKINKNMKDVLSHPDWVGFKTNNWVDPVPPYKYLNHSCDANTAIKGRKTLIAISDIKSGDEITIDYSIIEADPRWHMKCKCGSKNCRGIIKSIQELPEKVYKNCYPYISKDFQRIYERNNRK